LFDLSMPGTARLASSVTSGLLSAFDGDRNRVFVASYDLFDPLGRATIFDVTDFDSPRAIASFGGFRSTPLSLSWNGQRLLVGAAGRVDIADEDGQSLGHVDVAGEVGDLTVDAASDRVLAAAGDGGVVELALRGTSVPARDPAVPAPTRTPTSAPPTPSPPRVTETVYIPRVLARHDAERELGPLRHYSDQVGDVAVAGGRAVRIEGRHLVTYDVEVPTRIRPLGRSELTGRWQRIASNGDIAVVVGSSPAMGVFRLDGPAPRLVSIVPLPDIAGGVALSEGDLGSTHAFAAAGEGGLVAVDLSIPTAPRVVGSVPIVDGAQGVHITGDIALVWSVSWAEPVAVVDISDPSRPTVLSRLQSGVPRFGGGPAVIAGTLAIATTCGNCLEVFDISDPRQPRDVTQGNTLATSGSELAASGTRLYAGGLDGVETYDLTRLDDPLPEPNQSLVGSVRGLDEHAGLLLASTDWRSYGSDEPITAPLEIDTGTLMAFDIRVQGPLRAVGGYAGVLSSAGSPLPITIRVGGDGDVRPDYALSLVQGLWTTPDRLPGEPDLRCETPSGEGAVAGAQLLDLRSLPDVEPVGFVANLCGARRLAAEGARAYALVAEGESVLLRVIEFDVDGVGRTLGEVPLSALPEHWEGEMLAVHAGIVYRQSLNAGVSAESNVLQIVDARVPSALGAPIELPLDGAVTGVAFRDDWAFVATRSPAAVITLDIRDPRAPRVVGRLEFHRDAIASVAQLENEVNGLAAVDGFLFGGSSDGLLVIDASDPVDLRWRGSPGPAGRVLGRGLGRTVLVGEADPVVVDVRNPESPVIRQRIAPPKRGALSTSDPLLTGEFWLLRWTDYQAPGVNGLYVYPAR
jgi:hypothetical protein